MSNYFCPECGYEGDEPICPHCNIAAESLEVTDDSLSGENSQTYSKDLMCSVETKDSTQKDSVDGWEEYTDEK